VNLERARELARASLANLEAHRQRIDDLNVYPVPDGDTGTNLTLTVRSIVEALEASSAEGHEAVAKELSRAALMGARGNSGVIFSQILRGFADVLAERDDVDSAMLARAFRSASDAAYRAVRRPVEGTMLTVIREMAEEAERRDVRALPKDELLDRVVARGEEALARTPELLDVLREAGVVDAGGAGLVELVRGLAAGVAGKELPATAPTSAAAAELTVDALHQELSRYRYCTAFVVEGEGLDAEELERALDPFGDSLLVVGDASALKVHVHTDDPGAALALATSRGTIEGVEIANMHRQTVERERRLEAALTAVPTLETGLVAVVPGEGNRRLFESYGATRVIEGGQTMNPSTAEIVDAVRATPAAEVIVLPNNSNVLLAAEQAALLADKPVRVVPSDSVPSGLAAIVRYLPTSSPEDNERTMREALASVVTGEVAIASRDVVLDGVQVHEGAWLGLVEGAAVACNEEFDAVAGEVIERLLEDGREILTLLTGQEAPSLDTLLARIGELHPEVEVDVHAGGQPHYPLLLSAE
jgi:DAK2 domain fusion protein YloV